MPLTSSPEKTARSIRRISIYKKLFFAAIATGIFFATAEGLLRLGLGSAPEQPDAYVGFSNQYPLFVPDAANKNSGQVRTANNKLVWFNDQRFAVKKPAGVRRVFCVGGSTTFGRPYNDTTSFCGWLRELLPLVDDSTQWELINAGGVSYASYRVAAVMDELAQYEPDLFVVYTGQNEFLERRTYADLFDQSELQRNATAALEHTRVFQLLKGLVKRSAESVADDKPAKSVLSGEVDEMLNHTVGPADYHRDEAWHDDVLEHYRDNLRRMKEIATRSGAEIIFIVPASNEKDCSPFKSELASTVDKSEQDRFQNAIDAASDNDLSFDEKLRRLQATKEIDAGYADIDYAMGMLQFDADVSEQAKVSFQAAIDHDVCPLRATSYFQSALRTFALKQDVMLVDFDKRLRRLCQVEHGHPVLGKEYFLDHVHPTIQTHRSLARWIIQTLQDRDWVLPNSLTSDDIDRVNQAVLARIDLPTQGVALRNLAKVMHWSGKFAEAAPRARDALRLLQDDPESLLVLADCLRQIGRKDPKLVDESIDTYERLLDVAPMYSRAYLLYGELLFDLAAYEKAEPVLSMATMALPAESSNQIRAQYFLGVTYLMLNNFDQADLLLSNVDEAYPNDPSTMLFLAQSKVGLGDTATAIQIYQRMIQASPADVEARLRLGLLFIKAERTEEAQTCFEKAIEIDPDNAEAKSNLMIVRQILSK